MTKLNQSQENNLNPNVLPFYESYKSTLLAQATFEEKISVVQPKSEPCS